MRRIEVPWWTVAMVVLLGAGALASGCGGDEGVEAGPQAAHGGNGSGGPARGGPGGWGGGAPPAAAVPVEVAAVARRSISSFLETNGTLEAENEVDLVARTSGPIAEILVEEGMAVRQGQLLARIDDLETRAQLEIAKVELNEAKLAFERAQQLLANQLISQEVYDQARSRFEAAQAQIEGDRILLGFTRIEAPFGGLIVRRYVKMAQQVSVNTPLLRLSDFDPLLCPIQVPERELPRLTVGQKAYLTVEAWQGERFRARVLRVSPVIDAATGTVRVTLEVRTQNKLRPGMFASVFLESETREDALVIPKAALSLESIGDIVYVAREGTASRREVELGYQEGDFVEVRQGLGEGEEVIVVGQDGLSDGTPVQVLGPSPGSGAGFGAGALTGSGAGSGAGRGPAREQASAESEEESGPSAGGPAAASPTARQGGPPAAGGGREGGWRGGGGRPSFDPSQMTPEQLEGLKARMRQRGLSEEEIERRLQRMRERSQADPP